MSTLLVYTLATCPTCIRTKETLVARGVAFEERVLDDREDWQDEVVRLTGQYTVPVQVHPDGRVEVGFEGDKG